ncbi:MAG: hypothetical protein PUB15_07225 [Ruminobacter sp.]|nr:hypothetical protein [Ruminobacter sp.]
MRVASQLFYSDIPYIYNSIPFMWSTNIESINSQGSINSSKVSVKVLVDWLKGLDTNSFNCVLLLTDGLVDDISRSYRKVLSTLNNVKVSVIGIGPDANSINLSKFASSGKYYGAHDIYSALLELFSRDELKISKLSVNDLISSVSEQSLQNSNNLENGEEEEDEW